jgi:dTDP-4-amino-4,6-dideoxygalactose transaminase
LGPEVGVLEERLCRLFGCEAAIVCNSGFGAHLLTLIALEIGAGSRIAMPAFGPYPFAGTVRRIKGIPVFFDVAQLSFEAQPWFEDDVAGGITAVVLHDLFYAANGTEAISSRLPGKPIIRVSTHSMAALIETPGYVESATATTMCLMDEATLSAPGENGLILTNDCRLAERIRYVRSELNASGQHEGWESGNFEADTLQAAFLIQMLDPRVSALRARAHRVGQLLADIRAMNLPGIHVPSSANSACSHAVVLADRCQTLIERLDGLETDSPAKRWWPIPLHLQPGFRALGYQSGSFPNCEYASAANIELPLPCSDAERDSLISVLLRHSTECEREMGVALSK